MNNDLEQFSEERLTYLSTTSSIKNGATVQESATLARIALSLKLKGEQVPVITCYSCRKVMTRDQHAEADGFCPQCDVEIELDDNYSYTTPQPAHTEQDGWIKCSDNLPAETEDADGGATGYLVRYENDRVPNGGFNIGVSNCVFLRTHWRGLYSHWMPLPAAPKPESER